MVYMYVYEIRTVLQVSQHCQSPLARFTWDRLGVALLCLGPRVAGRGLRAVEDRPYSCPYGERGHVCEASERLHGIKDASRVYTFVDCPVGGTCAPDRCRMDRHSPVNHGRVRV